MKRKGLMILFALLFGFVFASCDIYANALNDNVVNSLTSGTYNIPNLDNRVQTIIDTLVLLVQVISIGGIVWCGVYYMFAGASKKAELKKSLLGISVGCIILFASSTIVNFIINVFNDVVNVK